MKLSLRHRSHRRLRRLPRRATDTIFGRPDTHRVLGQRPNWLPAKTPRPMWPRASRAGQARSLRLHEVNAIRFPRGAGLRFRCELPRRLPREPPTDEPTDAGAHRPTAPLRRFVSVRSRPSQLGFKSVDEPTSLRVVAQDEPSSRPGIRAGNRGWRQQFCRHDIALCQVALADGEFGELDAA